MTTYADQGTPRPRRQVAGPPPPPPRRPPPGSGGTGGGGPGGGGPGKGGSPGKGEPPKPPSVVPRWAKLCTIFGAVVMVVSGSVVVVPKAVSAWFTKDIHFEDIIPVEAGAPPKSIDGPINFLLLGMDERDGAEAEGAIRADSLILVHIPATHDKVYMVSLPRDAEVDIPDFPETGFTGFTTKINAAFAAGAQKNGAPDSSPAGRARGAKLTIMTINQLVPGGISFNGAAILNYDGFLSILKVLGGVDMCVDEEVWSIHYDRNGNKARYGDLDDGVGKYYPVGCYHMEDWEALDFARQRHLADGDYGRQRHQQQLIKAIIAKMTTTGVITDLGKIQELQHAAGDLLTLDLGGVAVEEWLFTLKSLRPDDLVMIKTNAGQFNSAGDGNEQLSQDSLTLLQHVQEDTVLDFLTTHPDWIAADK
jgi:anionic cell wall polymer biosynthesis LytR-Cps2A-Psr (LCP) family protein